MQDNPGSVTITWPSVTNRFYTVEAAAGAPHGFTPIWSGMGSLTESSFTDTNGTKSSTLFYRVRAEVP